MAANGNLFYEDRHGRNYEKPRLKNKTKNNILVPGLSV